LVDFIRENVGLTGTHVGCDTSQCGACVVHVDGVSVKACTILAAQAAGSDITTIEGIGTSDSLHPMQEAFREMAALQCGFCTPGILIAAKALLDRNNNPTENDVRYWLAGNLCRCTGYDKIIKAVMATAKEMRETA
jgi:carbon-monoxide dehydrogenase small subunit